MFMRIYQKPDFSVGSLCSKKPSSNMREESEDGNRRVQRRISKFNLKFYYKWVCLENPAAGKILNTTGLTYSC
jgi:hypothetical protein